MNKQRLKRYGQLPQSLYVSEAALAWIQPPIDDDDMQNDKSDYDEAELHD